MHSFYSHVDFIRKCINAVGHQCTHNCLNKPTTTQYQHKWGKVVIETETESEKYLWKWGSPTLRKNQCIVLYEGKDMENLSCL